MKRIQKDAKEFGSTQPPRLPGRRRASSSRSSRRTRASRRPSSVVGSRRLRSRRRRSRRRRRLRSPRAKTTAAKQRTSARIAKTPPRNPEGPASPAGPSSSCATVPAWRCGSGLYDSFSPDVVEPWERILERTPKPVSSAIPRGCARGGSRSETATCSSRSFGTATNRSPCSRRARAAAKKDC